MLDDKLMSHFITNLFYLTPQNVLIARMCRSFIEACTVVRIVVVRVAKSQGLRLRGF